MSRAVCGLVAALTTITTSFDTSSLFIRRSTLQGWSSDTMASSGPRRPMLSATPPSVRCRYGRAGPGAAIESRFSARAVLARIDARGVGRGGALHPGGVLVAARAGVVPERERREQARKGRGRRRGAPELHAGKIGAQEIELVLHERKRLAGRHVGGVQDHERAALARDDVRVARIAEHLAVVEIRGEVAAAVSGRRELRASSRATARGARGRPGCRGRGSAPETPRRCARRAKRSRPPGSCRPTPTR